MLQRNAVIRLNPSDAERYVVLRKRMLTETPWAFSSTPEDDLALDLQHLRRTLGDEENVILAVEATESSGWLTAVAGIFRMKSPKFSHRAKLWGVFVESGCRGRGLGRAVTTEAVGLARSWNGVAFIDVGVSANSPEALNLYRNLGFEEWGREPEATQYKGMRYDEIYMTLHIG